MDDSALLCPPKKRNLKTGGEWRQQRDKLLLEPALSLVLAVTPSLTLSLNVGPKP